MEPRTIRALTRAALVGFLAVTAGACGDDGGDDDDDMLLPDAGSDGGVDGGVEMMDDGGVDSGGFDGGVDGGVDGGPRELAPLVPAADSVAATGGRAPPAPFDTTAAYVGAERPGTLEGDTWWDGWTDFTTRTAARTCGGTTQANADALCRSLDPGGLCQNASLQPTFTNGTCRVAGEELVATQSAPGATCPAGNPTVNVTADITADTTWSSGNCYALTRVVYVRGAVLTIQPGTFITGSATGAQSALVVTTTGRLEAVGTRARPIVFTSGRPVAQRRRGDFGGLVMLGLAPINVVSGGGGTNTIEGLPAGTSGGSYGGTDATHDCGTVRYVRIEYAGFVFGANNELNSLTTGGCGSQTDIEFVQVSAGLDDGIEHFGGSPRTRHAFVFNGDDDGLDFDQGFTGTVQFAVVYNQLDRGFEWDNLSTGRANTPRTKPVLYNATVVGANGPEQEGARLKDGTQGDINNVLFQDFAQDECVNVQHVLTGANVLDNQLTIRNSIFSNCERDVLYDATDECRIDACPTVPGRTIVCDATTSQICSIVGFSIPWETSGDNLSLEASLVEQFVDWSF